MLGVVACGLVVFVVVPALLGAAVQAQNRAMSRCTATPPGFPARLSATGTLITVEWRLAPPGYDCVYTRGRRAIAKRPPP